MREFVHLFVEGLTWLTAGISAVTLLIGIWSFSWPRTTGSIESKVPLPKGWDIRYAYTVEGVEYHSGGIGPHLDSSWGLHPGGAEGPPAWTSAYDSGRLFYEGKPATVYYCRWYPSWACLRRGGFLTPIVLGASAVIIHLFGRHLF